MSIFCDVNERIRAGVDDRGEQSTFNHGLISSTEKNEDESDAAEKRRRPFSSGIWNSTRWTELGFVGRSSSDEYVCRLRSLSLLSLTFKLKRTRRFGLARWTGGVRFRLDCDKEVSGRFYTNEAKECSLVVSGWVSFSFADIYSEQQQLDEHLPVAWGRSVSRSVLISQTERNIYLVEIQRDTDEIELIQRGIVQSVMPTVRNTTFIRMQ